MNHLFATKLLVWAGVALLSAPHATAQPSGESMCEGNALPELLGRYLDDPVVTACTATWGRASNIWEIESLFHQDYGRAGIELYLSEEGGASDEPRYRIVGLRPYDDRILLPAVLRVRRSGSVYVTLEDGYGAIADQQHAMLVERRKLLSEELDVIDLFFYDTAADPWMRARAREEPRCRGEKLLSLIGEYVDDPDTVECTGNWGRSTDDRFNQGVRRRYRSPEAPELLMVRNERDRVFGVVDGPLLLPKVTDNLPKDVAVATAAGQYGVVVFPPGGFTLRNGGVLVFERRGTNENALREELRMLEVTLRRDIHDAWKAYVENEGPVPAPRESLPRAEERPTAILPHEDHLHYAMGVLEGAPPVQRVLKSLGAPESVDGLTRHWPSVGVTIRFRDLDDTPNGTMLAIEEISSPHTYNDRKQGATGSRVTEAGRPTFGRYDFEWGADGRRYRWLEPWPRRFTTVLFGHDAVCLKGTCVDGSFEADVNIDRQRTTISGVLSEGLPVDSVLSFRRREYSYRGKVDDDLRPNGTGIYTLQGKSYAGEWRNGKPRPDTPFFTDDGSGWFTGGPLDGSLRAHGMTVTWNQRPTSDSLVARIEGEFRHGIQVGTHVVRACDGCRIRREAVFVDGVIQSGEYPYSKDILAAVAAEHQWELAAPDRARDDSLRQARIEEQARREEKRRREAKQLAERQAREAKQLAERQAQMDAQVEDRLAEFRRSAREKGIRILNAYRVEGDETGMFAFDLQVVEKRADQILIIGPPGVEYSASLDLGEWGGGGLFGNPIASSGCEARNGLCGIDAGRFQETTSYPAYLSISFVSFFPGPGGRYSPPVYLVQYEWGR